MSGHCNAAEWLNAEGLIECYGGHTTELHAGEVVPRWTGDGYVWTYQSAGEAVQR